MPVQEVGVRAIFDTSNFTAGLNRYVAGMAKAEEATRKTVAALNAMASAFTQHQSTITGSGQATVSALQNIAAAAKAANQAVNQAGKPAPNAAVTDLERQLEIQKFIKNEIKDRISEQTQLIALQNQETSALQRTKAIAELNQIQIFRSLRDIAAPGLQVPQGTFDAIRTMIVDLSDLGNAGKAAIKDDTAELRLLGEEVRDRIRSEQLINQLASQRLSTLEREKATLELETIELAKQARERSAVFTGATPDLSKRIENIRKAPLSQADLGGLSAEEQQLKVNRLISAEIKDRVRIEQIFQSLSSSTTTALQAQLLTLEKENIQLEQQKRSMNEVLSLDNQATLARIRSGQVTPADTGVKPVNTLDQQIEQLRIIQDEYAAQLEVKRLNLLIDNEETTAYVRQTAEIARATLALEAQQRVIAATKAGLNQQALADVRRVVIKPEDVGVQTTSPLEKELELNRLVAAQLQSQVTLTKALEQETSAEVTEIQRAAAGLEAANILLERQQRLAAFIKLGGDPAVLDRSNQLLVSAADLNKNVTAQIEKQAAAQGLILQEIAARVELEKQSLIVNDKNSTALQRQSAEVRIQQLLLEQNLRNEKAKDLGVPGGALQSIRAATVGTRDLAQAQKEATASTQQLTAKAIALGVAVQSVVIGGLRALSQGLVAASKNVLDTVSTFERLNLSIAFFASRNNEASQAATNYQDKIAAVSDEAQGLQIWLQKIAVASPFTTKEVTMLFRTSQAYGLLQKEAEVLTPLLVDAASAGGFEADVLERLALAMGQVRARGKLTGEEIRQLGNSGIPIRDILVKTLGIANDKFDELVESGALTSDIVIPAIIKALGEFKGAGEAVAFGTIGGLISSFQDLKEIATSKFFKAALDPLRDSLKSFFDVANNPQTMATIQVLGEMLGKNLVIGFKNVTAAVKGAIDAWINLDPAVKQQVVVFAAATVGIFALIAAFTLMVAAINLVTNPVVGLTLLTAFLLSEWTKDWRGITSAAATGAQFLADLFGSLGGMVLGAASSFASGLGALAREVSGFVSGIGSILTFWLAPGSPPRIAPDLDKWGKAAGQLYLDQYAEANAETPMNKLGDVVAKQLTDESVRATKAALDAYNARNPEFQISLAKDLNQQTRQAFGIGIPKAIEESTPAMVDAANQAGFEASEAYINGFGFLVPKFHAKIDPQLTKAIKDLGGGEKLSLAGAFAFTQFINGFKSADFGALDEVASTVEGFLRGMVDRGAISEGDLVQRLFGSRQDIAAALQEFRQVGSISESTLNKVASSSGEAGDAVRKMLTAYTAFARADDTLTAAQDKLTEVTKKYDDILKPIRAELERISELRQRSDENQQILSLRRLIANEAVSEFRKENARLKIAEIQQGRQVRGIEAQQKAETDTAQASIDSAKKKQEVAQTQLDLTKAQIQAQLAQVNMVGQEVQIMQKLREEIDNLQKKQKTDLDVQEALLKLKSAEIDDNRKAAKAKFILDKADSSELERQNAIIDLSNVAISRQQRLVEARDLGIPPEQLTSLRDMAVTLDDIGIKSKDDLSGLGAGLDGLTESTVNAKLEAAKWKDELEKARKKIEEVQTQLGLMFGEINDNLPAWLKIFPEHPGENPPILDTLDKYKNGILLVGAAIVAAKILGGLAGMLTFFQLLGGTGAATTVGGGAIAVGAGGEVGAILGATTGLTGFAAILSGLGVSIGIAVLALGGLYVTMLGVAKVMEWMNNFEWGKTMIELGKGPMGSLKFNLDDSGKGPKGGWWDWLPSEQDAKDKTKNLFGGDVFANPFANAPAPNPTAIQKYGDKVQILIGDAMSKAVGQGLDAADISAQVVTAINHGIAAGTIPDDPVVRKSAIDFMNILLQAYRDAGEIKSPSGLSSREVGEPIGEGIITGALDVLTPETAPTGRIQLMLLSLLTSVKNTLMGLDGSLPFVLGSTWMTGLINGIASQQANLADAMVNSINFALAQAQDALLLGPILAGQPVLPSLVPLNPVASRPSQIFPGGTTIINNTRNYYLTVNTGVPSQGVIRDFSIMETMGS